MSRSQWGLHRLEGGIRWNGSFGYICEKHVAQARELGYGVLTEPTPWCLGGKPR